MSRYFGPARIRIHGDQGVGAEYVGLARTLLGEQRGIHVDAYDSLRGLASQSRLSKEYTPKPTEQISRSVTLPNGVGIYVQHNTYMPIIDVWVPDGVKSTTKLTVKEYRGLLRALQDETIPCDPLLPTIGEVGDGDYYEGQFSELHPLYDPEDPNQQWLVYPASLSAKHNEFANYPLPPRGGTFVMDMIGAPFNESAFTDKFPLSACKMLVTGGGTHGVEPLPYDEPTFEWGVDDYIYNCPPKLFRIGRKDDMSGWPWVGADGVSRLVSIRAQFRNSYDYVGTIGTITVEFLRLNGGSIPELDGDYIPPLEIEISDDWTYDRDAYPFEVSWWYDISVMSISPKGDRAVLGIHDSYGQYARGVCYDFIIVDLAAEDEANRLRFISRYEINGPMVVSNYQRTVSGVVTHLPKITLSATSIPNPYLAGITARTLELVPEELPEPVYAQESVQYQAVFSPAIFLHFDVDGQLVKTCLDTYTGYNRNRSQNTTWLAGNSNSILGTFWDYPLWQSGVTYNIDDIVYWPTTIGGRRSVNAYRAKVGHFSGTTNMPPSSASSLTYTTSATWHLIFGRATAVYNARYWFRTVNNGNWNTSAQGPLDLAEDEMMYFPEVWNGYLLYVVYRGQVPIFTPNPFGMYSTSQLVVRETNVTKYVEYTFQHRKIDDSLQEVGTPIDLLRIKTTDANGVGDTYKQDNWLLTGVGISEQPIGYYDPTINDYKLIIRTENSSVIGVTSFCMSDPQDTICLNAAIPSPTVTLSYASGPEFTLTGVTTQVVPFGETGTSVEAVPTSKRFMFLRWSDRVIDNPRIDVGVRDVNVSPVFVALPEYAYFDVSVSGTSYTWWADNGASGTGYPTHDNVVFTGAHCDGGGGPRYVYVPEFTYTINTLDFMGGGDDIGATYELVSGPHVIYTPAPVTVSGLSISEAGLIGGENFSIRNFSTTGSSTSGSFEGDYWTASAMGTMLDCGGASLSKRADGGGTMTYVDKSGIWSYLSPPLSVTIRRTISGAPGSTVDIVYVFDGVADWVFDETQTLEPFYVAAPVIGMGTIDSTNETTYMPGEFFSPTTYYSGTDDTVTIDMYITPQEFGPVPQLSIMSIDGIGIATAFGGHVSAVQSVQGAIQLRTDLQAYKRGDVFAAYSGEYSLVGTVTTGGFSPPPSPTMVYSAAEDFHILAVTGPALYQMTIEGVTGHVLKPVFGPEKGILCNTQQISYVGWVYPAELVPTEV